VSSLTPRILPFDDRRPSSDWELRPTRILGVDDFFPLAGQPTERMVIHGHGFALARADNHVEVGGQPARVVHAEADRLVVLLDGATRTGPVKVTVGPDTATGPIDYEVLGPVGADEDGPPITFAGVGTGAAAGLPSTGTARVLVVLVAPSDTVPANPTQARQDGGGGPRGSELLRD
jgi:hypothetical protein